MFHIPNTAVSAKFFASVPMLSHIPWIANFLHGRSGFFTTAMTMSLTVESPISILPMNKNKKYQQQINHNQENLLSIKLLITMINIHEIAISHYLTVRTNQSS